MDLGISGLFALFGVFVGGGIQYILLEQKYLADAIDKVRDRQVLFGACVAQYLQFIRDIQYAEEKNKKKGEIVPLSPDQRADLSARHRAVVSSTYALMVCDDVEIASTSASFLNVFESYVDKHREITTGDQGEYEPQDGVKDSATDVLGRKVTLTWPGRRRTGGASQSK